MNGVTACVVCFSSFDPLVRESVNTGILVLLTITSVVLLGFAGFVVRIARRSGRGD
jgi:hypothetical protein